jgi:hypothetical protein
MKTLFVLLLGTGLSLTPLLANAAPSTAPESPKPSASLIRPVQWYGYPHDGHHGCDWRCRRYWAHRHWEARHHWWHHRHWDGYGWHYG